MSTRRGPIRVLFFVAEFYRFQGSQRSLLALLIRLPSEEFKPVVVFPGEGRCTTAYRQAGLDVIVLPAPEALNVTGKALLGVSVMQAAFIFITRVIGYNRRLARLVREQGVDFIHFNTPRSILLGGLSAKLCRKPSILHIRGQLQVLGTINRFISQLLPSRMILVSAALRSHIYSQFRKKCRLVHTGIDDTDINRSAPRTLFTDLPDQTSGRLVVCTFGAVCPFKGYHHLIMASYLLSQSGIESPVFLAVGEIVDQSYYSYLQTLMLKYNVQNVRFLGWQDNAFRLYERADVVVLPSIEEENLSDDGFNVHIRGNEGFPRAVLEAMYLGKPVIATRVAGTVEQIEHGESGLLVAPSDAQQLADAIAKLMENPSLGARLGRGAASRARTEFNKDRMVEKTKAVFREVVM